MDIEFCADYCGNDDLSDETSQGYFDDHRPSLTKFVLNPLFNDINLVHKADLVQLKSLIWIILNDYGLRPQEIAKKLKDPLIYEEAHRFFLSLVSKSKAIQDE